MDVANLIRERSKKLYNIDDKHVDKWVQYLDILNGVFKEQLNNYRVILNKHKLNGSKTTNLVDLDIVSANINEISYHLLKEELGIFFKVQQTIVFVIFGIINLIINNNVNINNSSIIEKSLEKCFSSVPDFGIINFIAGISKFNNTWDIYDLPITQLNSSSYTNFINTIIDRIGENKNNIQNTFINGLRTKWFKQANAETVVSLCKSYICDFRRFTLNYTDHKFKLYNCTELCVHCLSLIILLEKFDFPKIVIDHNLEVVTTDWCIKDNLKHRKLQRIHNQEQFFDKYFTTELRNCIDPDSIVYFVITDDIIQNFDNFNFTVIMFLFTKEYLNKALVSSSIELRKKGAQYLSSNSMLNPPRTSNFVDLEFTYILWSIENQTDNEEIEYFRSTMCSIFAKYKSCFTSIFQLVLGTKLIESMTDFHYIKKDIKLYRLLNESYNQNNKNDKYNKLAHLFSKKIVIRFKEFIMSCIKLVQSSNTLAHMQNFINLVKILISYGDVCINLFVPFCVGLVLHKFILDIGRSYWDSVRQFSNYFILEVCNDINITDILEFNSNNWKWICSIKSSIPNNIVNCNKKHFDTIISFLYNDKLYLNDLGSTILSKMIEDAKTNKELLNALIEYFNLTSTINIELNIVCLLILKSQSINIFRSIKKLLRYCNDYVQLINIFYYDILLNLFTLSQNNYKDITGKDNNDDNLNFDFNIVTEKYLLNCRNNELPLNSNKYHYKIFFIHTLTTIKDEHKHQINNILIELASILTSILHNYSLYFDTTINLVQSYHNISINNNNELSSTLDIKLNIDKEENNINPQNNDFKIEVDTERKNNVSQQEEEAIDQANLNNSADTVQLIIQFLNNSISNMIELCVKLLVMFTKPAINTAYCDLLSKCYQITLKNNPNYINMCLLKFMRTIITVLECNNLLNDALLALQDENYFGIYTFDKVILFIKSEIEEGIEMPERANKIGGLLSIFNAIYTNMTSNEYFTLDTYSINTLYTFYILNKSTLTIKKIESKAICIASLIKHCYNLLRLIIASYPLLLTKLIHIYKQSNNHYNELSLKNNNSQHINLSIEKKETNKLKIAKTDELNFLINLMHSLYKNSNYTADFDIVSTQKILYGIILEKIFNVKKIVNYTKIKYKNRAKINNPLKLLQSYDNDSNIIKACDNYIITTSCFAAYKFDYLNSITNKFAQLLNYNNETIYYLKYLYGYNEMDYDQILNILENKQSQLHCEQSIKNYNDLLVNFVGNAKYSYDIIRQNIVAAIIISNLVVGTQLHIEAISTILIESLIRINKLLHENTQNTTNRFLLLLLRGILNLTHNIFFNLNNQNSNLDKLHFNLADLLIDIIRTCNEKIIKSIEKNYKITKYYFYTIQIIQKFLFDSRHYANKFSQHFSKVRTVLKANFNNSSIIYKCCAKQLDKLNSNFTLSYLYPIINYFSQILLGLNYNDFEKNDSAVIEIIKLSSFNVNFEKEIIIALRIILSKLKKPVDKKSKLLRYIYTAIFNMDCNQNYQVKCVYYDLLVLLCNITSLYSYSISPNLVNNKQAIILLYKNITKQRQKTNIINELILLWNSTDIKHCKLKICIAESIFYKILNIEPSKLFLKEEQRNVEKYNYLNLGTIFSLDMNRNNLSKSISCASNNSFEDLNSMHEQLKSLIDWNSILHLFEQLLFQWYNQSDLYDYAKYRINTLTTLFLVTQLVIKAGNNNSTFIRTELLLRLIPYFILLSVDSNIFIQKKVKLLIKSICCAFNLSFTNIIETTGSYIWKLIKLLNNSKSLYMYLKNNSILDSVDNEYFQKLSYHAVNSNVENSYDNTYQHLKYMQSIYIILLIAKYTNVINEEPHLCSFLDIKIFLLDNTFIEYSHDCKTELNIDNILQDNNINNSKYEDKDVDNECLEKSKLAIEIENTEEFNNSTIQINNAYTDRLNFNIQKNFDLYIANNSNEFIHMQHYESDLFIIQCLIDIYNIHSNTHYTSNGKFNMIISKIYNIYKVMPELDRYSFHTKIYDIVGEFFNNMNHTDIENN